MSTTKHEFFKVEISGDGDFNLDDKTQQEINVFLANSNNIYVNHSLTVLSESQERYDQIKSVNRYVLISLVYRDLKDTKYDLSESSPKVEKLVRKEFEKGAIIEEPKEYTAFESATLPLAKPPQPNPKEK